MARTSEITDWFFFRVRIIERVRGNPLPRGWMKRVEGDDSCFRLRRLKVPRGMNELVEDPPHAFDLWMKSQNFSTPAGDTFLFNEQEKNSRSLTIRSVSANIATLITAFEEWWRRIWTILNIRWKIFTRYYYAAQRRPAFILMEECKNKIVRVNSVGSTCSSESLLISALLNLYKEQ